MKKIRITTEIFELSGISELPEEEQQLVKNAMEAAKNSYSPYSNFKVGASLLLENGKVINGSNQENAAYPSGLCAERVALFYANAEYPGVNIKSMAIAAIGESGLTPEPVYPCGSCRQVMLESESRSGKKLRLIMTGRKKIHLTEGTEQLLPMGFDHESLSH